MDYQCFTDVDNSIDLATMLSRDLPVSSQEKQLPLLHVNGCDLLTQPNLVSVTQKLIALAMRDGVIEVRERLNKENVIRIEVSKDAQIQDMRIQEDGMLYVIDTKGILQVHQIENQKISNEDMEGELLNHKLLGHFDLDFEGNGEMRISNIQTDWNEVSQLKDSQVIGLSIYGNTQIIFLHLKKLDGEKLEIIHQRLYTNQMLYSQKTDTPLIKQVVIAESELIHVLDSEGNITIINKDLSNDRHGIIFVLKKATDILSFHLFPEQQGFITNEPTDKTPIFKKQNRIDPFGFMLTFSKTDCVLQLWNLGSKISKQEGSAEIIGTLRLENAEKILDWVINKDLLLVVFQAQTLKMAIIQIEYQNDESKTCKFVQLNRYESVAIQLSPNFGIQMTNKVSVNKNRIMEFTLVKEDLDQTYSMKRYLIKFTEQRELFQKLKEQNLLPKPIPSNQDPFEVRSITESTQMKEEEKVEDLFSIIDNHSQNAIRAKNNNSSVFQNNMQILMGKPQPLLVQPQLLYPQEELPQNIFTEKQMKKLSNLALQQTHFSKKLSENFENCSGHIKKRVQQIKQLYPGVKGKTNASLKGVSGVIENVSQNVCIQTLTKTQVYYKNSELHEVNKMCQRVFQKAIQEELKAPNQDDAMLRAKREEKLKEKEKRAFEGLKTNLRGTCKELFSKHLKDILEQSVSSVNKELIAKPYKQTIEKCIEDCKESAEKEKSLTEKVEL